jgi:hypothetical protein
MSYAEYFTAEVRTKVTELSHRPDGDFCADLAAWLLDQHPEIDPEVLLLERREAALVKRQRDDAWRQLTTLERQVHGLRQQMESRPR